jgi:hypothetical protein
LIILIPLTAGAYGIFVLGQLTLKGPHGLEMTFGRLNFAKGKVIPELKKGYQIQFWTPSLRTKEIQGVHEWEKVGSDDKLDAFAETL